MTLDSVTIVTTIAGTYPTGEQYEIRYGQLTAVVTEVGATLRRLSEGDTELIKGFDVDEPTVGSRGEQLLPWPNRIRDGRYPFDERIHQLPLSEPERHNAAHGLVRHVPWRLDSRTGTSVTQSVRVFAQPGWPGVLEARLTHAVGPDGLAVELTATNVGTTPLPFGYASHPYLTVGEPIVGEVELVVPASSYLAVDDRLLPITIQPVDDSPYDRRVLRPLGPDKLDTAFTDLARDADGGWRVLLRHGERAVELWADASFGWVQVFTGGPYRHWGIAVEPMTCGPDAFNPGPTHADVLRLEPGQQTTHRWGIRNRE